MNLALAINNSVPPSRRGEINGVAMTIGSLAKAMGPSMSSVVFAWSISRSRPFPFGAPLIFLLLGLGVCVMAAAGWTAVGVDYQDEASLFVLNVVRGNPRDEGIERDKKGIANVLIN